MFFVENVNQQSNYGEMFIKSVTKAIFRNNYIQSDIIYEQSLQKEESTIILN